MRTVTRGEINRGDTHSPTALIGLQALLETRIARSGERDPQEDIAAHSLRWIEAHLATHQPLARLADFLGVSAATVHRLFRQQLGTTVRQKIAELRCQEAERMLASGNIAIKEVAYRLGYRHPHDFSPRPAVALRFQRGLKHRATQGVVPPFGGGSATLG